MSQRKPHSSQSENSPLQNRSSKSDEIDPQKEVVQGKWTDEENLKYMVFMDFHKNIFISKQKRKSIKIFKLLSDYIKTRTPRQCRSHFQKLMNKYNTISKFKTSVRRNVGKQAYDKAFEQYTETVQIGNFEINYDPFPDRPQISPQKETGVQTDINNSMFSSDGNFLVQNQPKKVKTEIGYYPIYFWNPSNGLGQ